MHIFISCLLKYKTSSDVNILIDKKVFMNVEWSVKKKSGGHQPSPSEEERGGAVEGGAAGLVHRLYAA